MEAKITYFESGGRHNTEATLKLVKERAKERNIKNIVLASISGFSAEKALEAFKDIDVKLTVVSLKGLSGELPEFPESLKEEIRRLGHNFCYASEVKYEFPEIVQATLRRFSEGLKVCVEIALIAAEAGYVKPGEEVIAVGGTGRLGYKEGGGLDTAVIIEAMRSGDFLELEPLYGGKEKRRKIKEIICKPR
ncbi:MAG: pyruvate kinase alpha/beta domain-containing protein [Candidatus Nezhaarchaeota archaeon]|nr:pyruvate kinase alpha/beta domain-containing protein [Candidatus Nezhaarchaeota archaeon]